MKRCRQDLTFAFKVPGLAPGLSIEELDKEFTASTEVSFIRLHSCNPTKPHSQPVPMTTPQPLIPGQMLVSAPKRRGAVVIKKPATPSSPASFDPHFASASGSMQMVDTEAQVKKRGVRMWVKGKLENFVGKS